jgi:RecJ-like exonuclease
MKLIMQCPGGCDGSGRIKALHRKCPTCHGTGSITLTKFHKLAGHTTELKNVLAFEEYLEQKKLTVEIPIQDTQLTP